MSVFTSIKIFKFTEETFNVNISELEVTLILVSQSVIHEKKLNSH